MTNPFFAKRIVHKCCRLARTGNYCYAAERGDVNIPPGIYLISVSYRSTQCSPPEDVRPSHCLTTNQPVGLGVDYGFVHRQDAKTSISATNIINPTFTNSELEQQHRHLHHTPVSSNPCSRPHSRRASLAANQYSLPATPQKLMANFVVLPF